jgi:hypothetical protein
MTRARDVANIDGILTTKGDIYAATAAATPARLGVGSNGDTLVADSSTSTGLSYQANWAAGKNKIINGDFRINQRGFTSETANGVYTFDRWQMIVAGDGTSTFTPQTFTPGAAPVAGYEATNFIRCVTTGQTTSAVRTTLQQSIEDVRTFAGQTVTVSFYAKANSGTPAIALELSQNFGSGGSATVNTAVGPFTISTSWARYSATVSIPSISGKTIGTSNTLRYVFFLSAGSDFNTRASSIGIQTNTFDIWGVQVEAGSVATAFQTATGTIQGELAACQRYYYRNFPFVALKTFGNGFCNSTTTVRGTINFPVKMRIAPTALEQSGTAGDYAVFTSGSTTTVCSSVPLFVSTIQERADVLFTVASGLTAGTGAFLRTETTAAYLGWSAEL